MVKLSIIIPYYETYNLTLKLLKELNIQKTNEVEIIVIDDGCNEIRLDEFKNFNIIHLEQNGGVSKARNEGIKRAKGKYIAFIDSDDMITMDYIDRLLYLINTQEEDIMIFNWLDITNNSINIKPDNCAVWKALYKNNNLPMFDETLRAREDYFFQQELSKRNLTKFYYNRVLYMYNSGREGSLWWKETHQ